MTRAEMDVMKILWEGNGMTVHDILDAMTEPRPAYTTVATVLKILEKKGFVGRNVVGRTHEFRPKVARETYAGRVMNNVLGNFFGGSVVQMMSFFAQNESISMADFDAIMGILEDAKNEEATSENSKKTRLWIRS